MDAAIITRIVALTDPPDPVGYRRHLQTLDERALTDLAKSLQEDARKPHTPRWGRNRMMQKNAVTIS